MFKYAAVFLAISLVAGALGLTNLSRIAKRISLVLFALFFVLFLAVLGLAFLFERASAPPRPTPIPAMLQSPRITPA